MIKMSEERKEANDAMNNYSSDIEERKAFESGKNWLKDKILELSGDVQETINPMLHQKILDKILNFVKNC